MPISIEVAGDLWAVSSNAMLCGSRTRASWYASANKICPGKSWVSLRSVDLEKTSLWFQRNSG
jgi:hypothetical protein